MLLSCMLNSYSCNMSQACASAITIHPRWTRHFIHIPHTIIINFLAGTLCICGLLLIYSSVIIPPQLCLWNYDNSCSMFPTLYFDVFVDSFFLVKKIHTIHTFFSIYLWACFTGHRKDRHFIPSFCMLHLFSELWLYSKHTAVEQLDIILQFFTGIHNEDLSYCDDMRKIALYNLSSLTGFWFDCVTSIPFSYMDLYSREVILSKLSRCKYESACT